MISKPCAAQMLSKVGAAADQKTLLIVKEADAMIMRAGRNVEKLAINTAAAVKVGRVLAGLQGVRVV